MNVVKFPMCGFAAAGHEGTWGIHVPRKDLGIINVDQILETRCHLCYNLFVFVCILNVVQQGFLWNGGLIENMSKKWFNQHLNSFHSFL